MTEQYSIVHMYHNFFIHSSINEHLGCFQVLAILNGAAMNNQLTSFRMVSLASFFTLLFLILQEALQFLFTFYYQGDVIRISEVIDISPRNLDSIFNVYSLGFCMMYFAYKLNKQDDNIQHRCTFFPNFEPVCCSMFGSNHCFLTCIQVSQEADEVIWYSHLFKHFPQFN